MKQKKKNSWQVYIILCSDNSLYTGITTDVKRRLSQHQTGQGAKYFRGHQPLQLVYLESVYGRNEASKKESKIKRMKHSEKCLLVSSDLNEIRNALWEDKITGA